MRYWIHRTRGVFHKNAVYFNPGMVYPLPDDQDPMRGSIEVHEDGSPIIPTDPSAPTDPATTSRKKSSGA